MRVKVVTLTTCIPSFSAKRIRIKKLKRLTRLLFLAFLISCGTAEQQQQQLPDSKPGKCLDCKQQGPDSGISDLSRVTDTGQVTLSEKGVTGDQRSNDIWKIPVNCGNGVINDSEECDGKNLNGKDCKGLGFDDGALICNPNCTFALGGCYKCGDGKKNEVEECETQSISPETGKLIPVMQFGNRTCKDFGYGSGRLECDSRCKILKIYCNMCGNGTVETEWREQCDGNDLSGQSCTSKGFKDGVLKCNPECQFDTTGCNR